MASCLGLYVESNLIKYAKVTKDHENLKIESFGIKFYDKLSETVNQIIKHQLVLICQKKCTTIFICLIY